MALERTEIRARELESGDLFREYGDDWHEAVTIEHGDDMQIQTDTGAHIIIDADSPVLVVKGKDQTVLDALATYLGTSAEWNSDTWATVDRLISSVRPDVGSEETGVSGYCDRFRAEMGRPAPAGYDMTPADD